MPVRAARGFFLSMLKSPEVPNVGKGWRRKTCCGRGKKWQNAKTDTSGGQKEKISKVSIT